MATPRPLLPAKQLENARSMRRRLTAPERLLWERIRNRQCGGYKFRKQHPFGPYILDFYCHDLLLAIEVDGRSHAGRQLHDAERERFLVRHGLQVIRIHNDQIIEDADGAARVLLAKIRDREDRAPSPNPSQREGREA